MTYQCPQCGLPRTGNQAMGLAMPQCVCSWQFTPPQTPPPKREWVGLTEEDKEAIYEEYVSSPQSFMEITEAKLKEKNT